MWRYINIYFANTKQSVLKLYLTLYIRSVQVCNKEESSIWAGRLCTSIPSGVYTEAGIAQAAYPTLIKPSKSKAVLEKEVQESSIWASRPSIFIPNDAHEYIVGRVSNTQSYFAHLFLATVR